MGLQTYSPPVFPSSAHLRRQSRSCKATIYGPLQQRLLSYEKRFLIAFVYLAVPAGHIQQTQWGQRFSEVAFEFSLQGMCQHGFSGCTNLQIFGTPPFDPAEFEAQTSLLQNRQILIPNACPVLDAPIISHEIFYIFNKLYVFKSFGSTNLWHFFTTFSLGFFAKINYISIFVCLF